MSDSATLLIGILIALALPVVVTAVALAIGLAGQDRRRTPDQAPPGWYDDPRHEAALRWWDGDRWTAATHE